MESSEQYSVHTQEVHREQDKHYFVFSIVTFLMIAITLVIVLEFDFQGTNLTIILILLATFYVSISFLLLEPRFIKEIFHTVTHAQPEPQVNEVYIDRPVIKEIDRPIFVDRPVIHEVEKEIIKEVEKPILKEVERPVYISLPKRSLNIPRYDYIGSSQTKVYHTRNCRLGKSIKKKYKVSHNDPHYFIKNHFIPCQACIQKIKRV